MRRPFGAWEAVRKGPISYWLMLWFILEFGKLKKTKVRRNLVGARSLEGLGKLGRLGLGFSTVHVSQLDSLVDY